MELARPLIRLMPARPCRKAPSGQACSDPEAREWIWEPSSEAAKAAGLKHPNCRHHLTLYIEGVTRIRDQEPNAVVGQSGGPTGVINASLVGVIEEARKHPEIQNIYGAVHAVAGIDLPAGTYELTYTLVLLQPVEATDQR